MWAAVKSRSHNPIKVFPFGANSKELMLYGTVEYVFKDESKEKATKDWAGRAKLRKDGDHGWKLEEYQVYLVGWIFPVLIEMLNWAGHCFVGWKWKGSGGRDDWGVQYCWLAKGLTTVSTTLRCRLSPRGNFPQSGCFDPYLPSGSTRARSPTSSPCDLGFMVSTKYSE